ncbi:MAG: DNA translocase FtsK 4TM domain-containing protein, partial [Alphaproteobacteria bacterium]
MESPLDVHGDFKQKYNQTVLNHAMPVIPSSLLSPQASKLLMRGMRRLWGGVVFVLGALLGLALLTHDFQDASLNTAASEASVQNGLGTRGAFFSDVVFQSFGMAAFVLPLLIMAWGGHFWQSPKAFRVFVRLGQGGLALCLGALLMALAGDIKQDAMDVPRGGVAGFWMHNLVAPSIPEGTLWGWVMRGGVGLAFGAVLFLAMGLWGSGVKNAAKTPIVAWVWGLPSALVRGFRACAARLSVSGAADLAPLFISTHTLMASGDKHDVGKSKKPKAVAPSQRPPLSYHAAEGFSLPP